ncbi:alpha-glucuronidase A [Helicocarpus griseus UAMH5409]|uniref:Alpha-glucuronidase n=1 Tax=Helicocarpus griseus UAMH5409 TaxID=1447875 RepID=A0A2B7XPG1_9EURO|nr:alpha-glucuronidase A [Helicocarpus griseus UAMH5409]
MFKLLLFLFFLGLVAAENGLDGWLRYAPIPFAHKHHGHIPDKIVALNSTESSPVNTAGLELQKGFKGIFDKRVKIDDRIHGRHGKGGSSVIVGTVEQYANAGGKADVPSLGNDGFWLDICGSTARILGQNERGALYGAFEYLSRLAQGKISDDTFASNPDAPIRWINQWDNLNEGGTHGSIERGYGGYSIFFDNGTIVPDLTRAAQYARLLASIRVNAVVVNNVNANYTLLTEENMDGLARIADVFRPWGIQMGLSLYFASPEELGGLDTFDPLDERVIAWWHDITDKLYKRVPDMAGYLVKANSEGQPGPLTYNRTLAEGANLFAKAVQPYGGVVMFRAFVYDSKTLNQTLDWRADRANAAVEYFGELDGKFDDNVVVQIKYGPIDFQVREPASPLFANLFETNTAIELQITQEYLGQQCHVVYLPPLWRTILDFDMRVDQKPSLVSDIVSGKRFNRKLGGYAGVANVGTNTTWLGSHLAMSNLYAYGRLAWDPSSDSVEILQDWTRLTFGFDPKVLHTITKLSMDSWPTYEKYTGNLGIQTLTDILLGHYGPNPASQDGNPWGQWTRADSDSIGMDRTVWNGTRFAGQYPSEVAELYEHPETTPDDLLLWFHHVPYTHRLHSGKTVIQHFYDEHYDGAARAQDYVHMWKSLRGRIDKERYEHVLHRLIYQAGHALVWRDSINTFYFNKSGIPDDAGRVANHPYRIEAEDMILGGYLPYAVSPFEAASGATAVVTASNSSTGTAEVELKVPDGKYDLAVNYFDLAIGRSEWSLSVGGREVGRWEGDSEYVLGHAPSPYIDGHSAMRITFENVWVRNGDKLRIVGQADGEEPAPLDYVSVLPVGVVD